MQITNPDKIFFTADQHVGHANILKYCDRPFETIESHDDAVVQCWNKCVPDNGDVGVDCWDQQVLSWLKVKVAVTKKLVNPAYMTRKTKEI